MADWIPKSTTASVAAVGLAAGTAAYMWACRDPEGYVICPESLEEQSIEHEEIPACRISKFADAVKGGHSTVYELFTDVVNKYGDRPCFGWRSSPETDFDCWLTYDQVLERVTSIGYGLRCLKQEPKNDTFIGMFSKNRAEMAMTQLACYQHSMVIVPMYDTLGDEGIEHIVKQTAMKLVICDDEAKMKNLLKFGSDGLPSITTVVHMEPVSNETLKAAGAQGWTVLSFRDMEAEGEKNPVGMNICKSDDLCVLCYTSGTTGKPKGAMIRHSGLSTISHAALEIFTAAFNEDFVTDSETYLSYLPLAHMYEQAIIPGIMTMGGKIGFYSGDIKELLNDIKYLRPTFFASVPRLLNRIYDKVIASVNQSSFKSWLFNKAMNAKEEYYKRGIITKSTIWDKLVFKKVQNTLGGRVKVIITGAAPISSPVLRFLRLAFGAVAGEGYGQTESSAAMTVTLCGETAIGEVGPPLPCNIIKLVDVPEMNYYAADNVGEVCGYGVNVFKGYLHDEAKTSEAIDSEGWLHTGDIGTWTERGTLKIIDRKKNIFKLSQGEYIAPEKIENAYVNCPLVAQCFVHGDSLKSSLVGVMVVDPDVLPGFAKSELGLNIADLEELCQHDKVKAAVMAGLAKAAKLFNLKGFEQVRDIHVTAEPFSVENNLLTPTFKLKRIESRAKYQDVIDKMYENPNL